MSAIRTFELHRDQDVSGYSGTGVVADGVVFDDGVTVLRWRGERRSTVTWASVEDAVAVHGHDGKTRLVWTDQAEPGVTPLACGCTAVRTPGADGGAASGAHSNALVAPRPEDELGRTLRRIAEEAGLGTRLIADSRCRSCSAPIAWFMTPSSKRLPVDPAPTTAGNVVIDGTLALVLSDVGLSACEPGTPRYTSHFATCPDANAWRSKGADRG